MACALAAHEGAEMHVQQFTDAVASVRSISALDEVVRLTWRALAEAQISEVDAEAVSSAVQARREALKGFLLRSSSMPVSARRRPVSPDRKRSIERRRRMASSGAVPGFLACHFTQGECAALSVIARDVQRHGKCVAPIDKIAALAGVCRTVVQNALRQGRRIGVVSVSERRRAGRRSDTNVVTISCPDWRAWLRIAGGRVQKRKPHGYKNLDIGEKASGQSSRDTVPGLFVSPSVRVRPQVAQCQKSKLSASET